MGVVQEAIDDASLDDALGKTTVPPLEHLIGSADYSIKGHKATIHQRVILSDMINLVLNEKWEGDEDFDNIDIMEDIVHRFRETLTEK